MLACAGATAPWSADDGVAAKLCTRSNRSWCSKLIMVSSNCTGWIKPPKKRWLISSSIKFSVVNGTRVYLGLSFQLALVDWRSWGGSFLLQTATAAIKVSESVSWRQEGSPQFFVRPRFSPRRQARLLFLSPKNDRGFWIRELGATFFFPKKSEALEVVIDSPTTTSTSSTPAWNSGAGIAWCIVWHWKGICNLSDLQFSDFSFF